MKILVVDDKEEQRYMSRILLQGSGYDVITANNGEDALSKLRAAKFDLILSDILMPIMDGFKFCQAVQADEKLRTIPFIFHTATYTEKHDEELALKVGATRFIRKPTDPDEFLKIIKDVSAQIVKGTLGTVQPVGVKEEEVLKLYNESLIRKLEKKMEDLEAETASRKQAQEKAEYLNSVLRAISAINELIIREKDRNVLLNDTCKILTETRNFEMAAIYLFDEYRKLANYAAAGTDTNVLTMVKHLQNATIIDCVNRTLDKPGVTIIEVPSSGCGECPMLPTCNGKTLVTIRIEHGEKVYGLLRIRITKAHPMLREEQALLAEAMGDIGFALHDMELEETRQQSYEKIRTTLNGIVNAIAAAIEIRDPYTAGHQLRVAQLGSAIAREMNLPEERVSEIYTTGLIHDIGKIGVPSEILAKPGRLNETEYSIVKCHSQSGYDVLKNIEFPYPIARWVLEHHERLNGSGYPNGLTGDKISQEAKILAVADVVEAMLSHRPYRPALGMEKALTEITSQRNVLYDTDAVNACLKLFIEKGFNFK